MNKTLKYIGIGALGLFALTSIASAFGSGCHGGFGHNAGFGYNHMNGFKSINKSVDKDGYRTMELNFTTQLQKDGADKNLILKFNEKDLTVTVSGDKLNDTEKSIIKDKFSRHSHWKQPTVVFK